MPTLELQRPFETTEPRLRVESILLPGRHRFRLIVVDNDGIESDPVDTLVTIVGQVPSGDAFGRAREARGRVFYATGVLLDAHHLDSEQLYDHPLAGARAVLPTRQRHDSRPRGEMGEGDRRSQRAARCEARHRARSARPDHRSAARRGPPAGPLV